MCEVKYSSEYDAVCCFCVPFDDDADKLKALADKAKATNQYGEDCIWDCDYVKGRVEVYGEWLHSLEWMYF